VADQLDLKKQGTARGGGEADHPVESNVSAANK
jgi:hypothetical protein